jgi:hypothetical protein
MHGNTQSHMTGDRINGAAERRASCRELALKYRSKKLKGGGGLGTRLGVVTYHMQLLLE